MTDGIDGRTIRGIDCTNDKFRRTLKRIKDPQLQLEIREALRSLLFLEIDRAPRKYHLHPLTGKSVPSCRDPNKAVSVWTLHVTSNDAYKASFTFEDGVCYMRLVDEHDVIDKHP